jgi:predicted glycosyltransferase
MKNKIWIDVKIPCEVFFFNSIISQLKDYKIYITSCAYAEIPYLLNYLGLTHTCIGKGRATRFEKIIETTRRTLSLALKVPEFDVSLGFGNMSSILVSNIRAKPCINYDDNELGLFGQRSLIEKLTWKITTKASYIICPSFFPIKYLLKEGFREDRILQYKGYKEEVYIADYHPDPNFYEKIPFKNFVVIRPEVLSAAYIRAKKSLVPDLIKALLEVGVNIVYVPRNKRELMYAEKYLKEEKIFIPQKGLNGLDLCWYANAVLSGSGTMAREAACMGTTSVSFFPGERLLAVDQQLCNEGKMLHSRNVKEIVNYLLTQPKKDKKPYLERCKKVKEEVVNITKRIIEDLI